MLLHDNRITFSVNLQAAVVFHSKVKCTSCILIVCFECISIMADSDKTLIGENKLSNNDRNPHVPNTSPASSDDAPHPEPQPTHPVTISEPLALKRKQTSFQITSVTVQGSRLSTDGGEDSADDLDESHTEDVSSEILDCSRTTDPMDNDQLSEDNSNANNEELPQSAPSIPAKCKVEVSAPSNISENVPSETPAAAETMSVLKDADSVSETVVSTPTLPDQWQQRFRVVKIVSSEPFKRGRWLCMDFMDPPAPAVESKPEVSDSVPSSQLIPSVSFQGAAVPADRVAHIYEISPNDTYPGSISVAMGQDQSQQPMYGIFLPLNNGQYPFVPGMPPGSLSLPMQKDLMRHETSQQTTSSANQAMQQQQQQNYSAGTYVDHQQAFQPTQGLPAPGATQHAPIRKISAIQVCPPHQSQPMVKSSISAPQQPATVPSMDPPMQQPVLSQPSQGTSVTNAQSQLPPNSSTTTLSDSQNVQPQYQPMSTLPVTQTPNVPTQAPTVASIPDVNPETVNVPSQVTQNHIDSPDVGTPSSIPSQEAMTESTSSKNDINGEDPESAPSGTSTVAIDNKIEQAMDLVKSHLMFAVREEVDVLKEKITELMDRISQLEYENGFLRANASQQTLEHLTQSQLLQQQQNLPSAIMNSFQQAPQQPMQPQQLNVQNQQSTS